MEEDKQDEEAFYRRSREFSQSFSVAYNRQEKETLTFQLNVPENILQNKLESTSKQARHISVSQNRFSRQNTGGSESRANMSMDVDQMRLLLATS